MSVSLGVGPTSGGGTGSSTTITVTLTGTTAGRSIIVLASWQSTATVNSITCSGESNLTVDKLQQDSFSACVASLINNTGGGDKTITITLSSSSFSRSITAIEFYPLSGLDNTVGASGTSTNPSTNLTTLSDNALVVGSWCIAGGDPSGAGSGYTGAVPVASAHGFYEYDLDGGSAGSRAVDCVKAASDFWVEAAASYVFDDPNESITPPVGSLVLTGVAPGLSHENNVPAGSLTLTGAAPLIFAGQLIVGVAGELVLTGTAPTLSLSDTQIIPPVVALTLSGAAPTVLVQSTIPTGALVITGLAPTLSATQTNTWEPWTSDGLIIPGSLAGGSARWAPWTAESALSSPYALNAAVAWEPWTAEAGFPLVAAVAWEPWTATGRVIELLQAEVAWAPWVRNALSGAVRWAPWQAVARLVTPVSAVFTTKVMNTRNLAVTEYTNYPFNSYAKIGEFYYGASSGGLFRLEGALDHETKIAWIMRTGQMDDQSVMLKRLPEIVMALRASGPVRVRVWKDDNSFYDYMLPPVKSDTIHQHRVNPGKGMLSRYYMVELQGVDGADVEIDSMMVNMSQTSRKVG